MKPAYRLGGLLACVLFALCGCATSSADSVFFGDTTPPEGQVMRYISGGEPESLDPLVGSGQPEARIYMSMFEGLTEYDPKTMLPIPALAESWDVNDDFTQFVFHLRPNGRWSNGDPITADDFVYSLRRGLTPSFAARNAYLAYYVLNAQGFNEGGYFAKDPATGAYVMDDSGKARAIFPPDKPVAGKEMVKIQAEDVGIEALDARTVRYTLNQPAPFFVGLTAHQFFRIVPRKIIEKYGDVEWTQPENIVTSGPFKMKEWTPYDKLVVVRDPMYWDAAHVKLDEIHFYAIEDTSTMMNLYKAGEVDATYNHTVPPSWLDVIKPKKDFMSTPELGNDYYQINTKRPPMNDKRVREAFNMSVDKEGLALYRKTATPLTTFVPSGVVAGYPKFMGAPFDAARARALLVEAGYKDAKGNYDPSKFPINDVEITYNTLDTNRQVAEYLQAQWKQNLSLTIPIKNMEFKTFLVTRASLDYKGLARSGWITDYVDPFSFLNLFYTPTGDNGTGWWDPKYVKMLNEANHNHDPKGRFEMLANAEKYMLDAAPVIPLMTRSTDWMKKPYVKGMYPNPGTLHAWKFVYIEHDPAKWDYGIPDMTPRSTLNAMLRYIVRRLLITVPMVLIVISVTWGLIRLAPGNFYTGERALPPAVQNNLRAKYGLDRPWYVQYGKMIGNTLRGDFGTSLKYEGQSVNTILARTLPVSATIGLLAYMLALAIGVVSGTLAAVKHNSKVDYASMTIAMLGISLPNFVLGPLLVLVFSLALYWLPPARWEGFPSRNVIMPVLTLSAIYMAYVARLTRAGMLEVMRADYIRTARAKGLDELTIVIKHALRGGLLPVISFSGPALAILITGTVVVERIFALPGLGNYFINANLNRDEPLIIGIVAFVSITILIFNLLVDIAYGFVDPRIRY